MFHLNPTHLSSRYPGRRGAAYLLHLIFKVGLTDLETWNLSKNQLFFRQTSVLKKSQHILENLKKSGTCQKTLNSFLNILHILETLGFTPTLHLNLDSSHNSVPLSIFDILENLTILKNQKI